MAAVTPPSEGDGVPAPDSNYIGQRRLSPLLAAGKQLATYDSAGTHFTLTDWLGSKRMQLSEQISGSTATVTVGEQCTSLPYGDGQTCTGSDVNQLHFTGKERDQESTNDYFESRYYASNMGARFLSPDDGSDQDSSDPQSWNLYSYVQNNPLTNTDPDGHDLESIAVNCYLSTSSSTVSTSEGGSWQDFTSSTWCLATQAINRTLQTASKLISQTADYLTAPRDPECMNAFAAAGATAGAAQGTWAGAGIGGAAGAVAALPTGETADLVTVPGGALVGGAAGAAVGGGAGGVGGAVAGYFACASGGGSGGGGKSGASSANKLSNSEANRVANEAGYSNAEALKKDFVGPNNGAQWDLYKQPNGDIEIFRKGGLGEGIETESMSNRSDLIPEGIEKTTDF